MRRASTSGSASSPTSHDIVFESPLFPMYCMRVVDFMALSKLHTHNELIEMALVTPLDLHGEHEGAAVNFISHEWLGYDEADPQGVHLRTMQEVFRRIIADEPVFKSEEDWQAYAHGFKTSGASIVQLDSSRIFLEALGAASRTPWEFRQSIEAGWVWMDFISIPQTVGVRSDAKLRIAQHDQANAVRSIPYYIKNSGNFWICAPATLNRDGAAANYASWAARGWCRLEDQTNMLVKLGDGRALLVTHPFGEPPALTADEILVYSQRYNAVLTGAYSCCEKGHRFFLRNGRASPTVPCDKVAIRELLRDLYDATMCTLRQDFFENATFRSTGSIWDCTMQNNIPFHKYVQLSVTRPMLLAESLDEPDWVTLGWSVSFDRIDEAELSAYWAHYGLRWPQPASAMVIPALEGNLPMLRYFIERAGCSAACTNPSRLSPLIAAARGGHCAVVSYLCERLDVADIDYQNDSGLSALADAAMRNHPDVLRELLKHGASVDIRRNDGKTPYLMALQEGHDVCVSILLAAGADPCAADHDGPAASDLTLVKQHAIDPSAALRSLPIAPPLHMRRRWEPSATPASGWADLKCVVPTAGDHERSKNHSGSGGTALSSVSTALGSVDRGSESTGWSDLQCGVPTASGPAQQHGSAHGRSAGTASGQSGSHDGFSPSSAASSTFSDLPARLGLGFHRYDENQDLPSLFELPARLSGVSSAPQLSPKGTGMSPVSPSSPCDSACDSSRRRKSNPLHGAEQAHIRFARAYESSFW